MTFATAALSTLAAAAISSGALLMTALPAVSQPAKAESAAPTQRASSLVITGKSFKAHCAEQKATLRIRVTAPGVASWGSGKTYYIKSSIKWQTPRLGGKWLTYDHADNESGHFQVTNPRYELFHNQGDLTGWGGMFQTQPWRAYVEAKLMRERTGPDKKLATAESSWNAREWTSQCGVDF